MKNSPTYRMKANYITATELVVGRSYVIAPNGQAYFTVLDKTDTGLKIEYPKRNDEYRVQFKNYAGELPGSFYKEKKVKQ